jgi:hypothetical protein
MDMLAYIHLYKPYYVASIFLRDGAYSIDDNFNYLYIVADCGTVGVIPDGGNDKPIKVLSHR